MGRREAAGRGGGRGGTNGRGGPAPFRRGAWRPLPARWERPARPERHRHLVSGGAGPSRPFPPLLSSPVSSLTLPFRSLPAGSRHAR